MKNILKVNYEYYVFVSGALSSLHINVLFLLNEKWRNIFWWIALLSSLAASILFLRLSIQLRKLQNEFADNIKYARTERQREEMWLEIYDKNKKKPILSLVYIIFFMIFTIFGISNF